MKKTHIIGWFLLIHFIPVQNKYDVWYIVVFIDYLLGIHMTITFQIIQHWIGKYDLYNHRILVLKKTWMGDSPDLSVIVVYYLQ